ncbi:hypothetical protein KKA50_01355 [Patescibacteria group bacterium]|nr:hypothetical protein [Patescibacteria group bacterium]
MKFSSEEEGLIYYAKDDINLADVVSDFKKGYLQASKFFNAKIPKIKLILVYSRKELDNLFGHQTPDWFVGYANSSNEIFILSPSVWKQESSHSRNEFNKTLCHEIAHVFTRRINKSCEPMWFNEGLACVVAKQKIKLQKDSKLNLYNPNIMFFLDSKKNWEQTIAKEPGMPYVVSFMLVDFLIRRFGKQKIFQLLTGFNEKYNKRKFCQKFEGVYRKSIGRVVKEFLAIQ